MTFRRRLAACFRALAAWLDPPLQLVLPAPAELVPSIGARAPTQTETARRLVAEHHLRRALRRYSPPEERGQA